MPDCLVSDLEFHDNHLVFEPFDVGMKLARRHLPIRLLVHLRLRPCFLLYQPRHVESAIETPLQNLRKWSRDRGGCDRMSNVPAVGVDGGPER